MDFLGLSKKIGRYQRYTFIHFSPGETGGGKDAALRCVAACCQN